MILQTSWAKFSKNPQSVMSLLNRKAIKEIVNNYNPGLALGMGRSYGDVSSNPKGILWKSTDLDRFHSFDPDTGILRCEAGVLLNQIHDLTLNHGWMLPVNPGTQFITVGGAIANDVHGKNHHVVGTFGQHVNKITLLRTNGDIIECSPCENLDWFAATIGGLGLTGVILSVELQLRRISGPFLTVETIVYSSMSEFSQLVQNSLNKWEYLVSWIDCGSRSGRGIFMRANHSDEPQMYQTKKPWTFPVIPFSLINPATCKILNPFYFNRRKREQGFSVKHFESFFYPLDSVKNWNRAYGPKGFFQYQSVIPHECAEKTTQNMLSEIKKSSESAFLSVLKNFAIPKSLGLLSFPIAGLSLAIDFADRGFKTRQLLERLDAIVSEAGGRLYPAKDARMSKEFFKKTYPRWSEFLKFCDPNISSALKIRLLED